MPEPSAVLVSREDLAFLRFLLGMMMMMQQSTQHAKLSLTGNKYVTLLKMIQLRCSVAGVEVENQNEVGEGFPCAVSAGVSKAWRQGVRTRKTGKLQNCHQALAGSVEACSAV